MEFRDLKMQYQKNREKMNMAINGVLQNGVFIGGEPVKRLEKILSEYVGVQYCVTCANGTDALLIALMTLGIGKGDAVFVPDFTFFSTAEVVPWVGATPVFVDVDKKTFNISTKSLEGAIDTVLREGRLRPRIVIAVDLFGQPADYTQIREIVKKYDMLLVEDGAQGFGGSLLGKRACAFGDIATTSFFPAKPLGCYGDGGALFTNNCEWVNKIESLKVHGKGLNKYDNVCIGMNSRLDTLQAAVLIEKMKMFTEFELEAVNEVAKRYSERLQGEVEIPIIDYDKYSSWAQYTILLKSRQQRDGLQCELKQNGIPSMIYYMKGLHEQEAMRCYRRDDISYNVTEEVSKSCLSLPIHPYMMREDVDGVCNAIIKFIRENGV